MSFKVSDFNSLQFNPLCSGKMLTEYPRLSEIVSPEWTDEADLDKIIRYCILVYDPKSALVANEKDLNYRKGIAADISKLDVDNEEYIQSIYNLNHPITIEFTIRFLIRFVKSKEWAAICALEASFWESIRKVLEPITGKNSKEELDSVQKKSTIKQEIDLDIKRLDTYYKIFFGEDSELENKAKGRVTPESIAKLK